MVTQGLEQNISPRSQKDYYERLYTLHREPWNYSKRGAEILRYALIIDCLKAIQPRFNVVLDIGCGLGQLTQKLIEISQELLAIDVSPAAVSRAAGAVKNPKVRFLAAKLPGMPFAHSQFDLIVSADGIYEFVPDEMKDAAISDISRTLKPGGYALFSDYLKHEHFQNYQDLIAKHLKIVKVQLLNDRLWYQFESWFKAVRNWGAVKKVLSSTAIAQALSIPAKMLGRYGSSHILILAQKPIPHD